MKRRFGLAPLTLALLALAPACDDDGPSGPEFSSITGTWAGTEFELTFTFDITESESGDLTGHVDFASADNQTGGNIISGRRERAHVVMVVGAPGFLNATFRGDLSADDRMTLGVAGFGFRDEEDFRLELQRQSPSAAFTPLRP